MERANVLIVASGNGCYLTGLINQDRVKRLGAWEAEREQRRQRAEESPGGVCRAGAPLGAPSSCLTPIQDAHRHPHSCFCHTQLVNQRVRNEYSAIIRIFLHIRALCVHAKKKQKTAI